MAATRIQITIDNMNAMNGTEFIGALGGTGVVVCGMYMGLMPLLHMSVLQHWIARPYRLLALLHCNGKKKKEPIKCMLKMHFTADQPQPIFEFCFSTDVFSDVEDSTTSD